jgi:hypothetical protein
VLRCPHTAAILKDRWTVEHFKNWLDGLVSAIRRQCVNYQQYLRDVRDGNVTEVPLWAVLLAATEYEPGYACSSVVFQLAWDVLVDGDALCLTNLPTVRSRLFVPLIHHQGLSQT